jgi:hypothetical protein
LVATSALAPAALSIVADHVGLVEGGELRHHEQQRGLHGASENQTARALGEFS